MRGRGARGADARPAPLAPPPRSPAALADSRGRIRGRRVPPWRRRIRQPSAGRAREGGGHLPRGGRVAARSCRGAPDRPRRAADAPRVGHATIYDEAREITEGGGRAAPAPAEPGRGRCVRFEWRHSGAARRAGWHEMKDSRPGNPNLVARLVDPPRCAAGAAASRVGPGKRGGRAARGRGAVRRAHGDAVRRRLALRGPGSPRKGRREGAQGIAAAYRVRAAGRPSGGSASPAPKGSRRPTAFEGGLLAGGIDLTSGRPRRPQANGKPGRFFGTPWRRS